MVHPVKQIQDYKAEQRLSFASKPDRRPEYRELGYNAEEGKAVLQGDDGGIIKSEPITNGYRAPGQSVSVQRSGNVAQSNSMPRPRSANPQPQGKAGKTKPIKFLFVRDSKYYVGGHLPKPIEVGKDGLRPIVIENHGGRKFALIGYKGGNIQDIVIQKWDGNRITNEITIKDGYQIGGLKAGTMALLPASTIVNNSNIQQSQNKSIFGISDPKATSGFGAGVGIEWGFTTPWRHLHYTDTLKSIGGNGFFEQRTESPNPNTTISYYTAIAAGQMVILPDRLLPWSTSDVRVSWSYTAGFPSLGLPTIEAQRSDSYAMPLITDFNLNSSLCVQVQYDYSASATVGFSQSSERIASNLILVNSGGGDLSIAANFNLKDMDFLPGPPNQAIDTGKSTTIAPAQNTPADSLHFLNFGILQGGKLSIVDPIKDELNVWALSNSPTKTTKKADYYPLPKNAQILGAQWHQ